ncbi:E3 ubiquitin-protein ligase RFWD3 [Triticum urartu]|uniref:RING-type E3 ubiquitin transferase n=1 Tax=Triticum urartu TaxID=4572 RepID=M7Z488_TRIUA|nr:E3 ubiquitin-protein ligase RFWD3 [Triticum urartu]
MPPRRGRRATPPVLILEDEDLDFEVSYSEGEDGEDGGGSDSSSSSLSGEEEPEDGTDVEDGERSDEGEEEEQEESVAEGCGPAVQARVPGGAAAERAATNAPTCPVCMEPWTSEGDHRISCIPCGHVYGRSCLERWLTQRGNASATCPQCGRRFKHKDIINIYAPEVAVPNNDLEKQLRFCRQKLESLEEVVLKQGKLLDEIISEKCIVSLDSMFAPVIQNHRSADVGVSKRQKIAEHSDGRTYLEPSASASAASASVNSCRFVLLKELSFDGARVMGIDASNQIILASGKAPGVGGEHVLRKLPAWSCSAHDSDSHRVYAGLQDGRVLVFDTRQHSRPLHSMAGLSKHLVHTLHSVTDNSASRKLLSASAIGPCMWDADGNQSSPKLLLEDDNQRVCFSLACAPPSSDLLVASYRPKADYSSGDAGAPSQAYLSQTSTQSGAGKLGQHTVIRRTGNASFAEGSTCHSNVSEVRMCKSAIVPCGNDEHLFAYGDESHRGVLTWRLPSLGVHSGLIPHRQPILDLRYAGSRVGGGYLGCLSDDKLQVYRVDR